MLCRLRGELGLLALDGPALTEPGRQTRICQADKSAVELSCQRRTCRPHTPSAAADRKGVSEGEVTSEDREHAKRIVYSVVYGAGRERLSGILGVSAEQASRFQDSFLQTYKEVQTFIQRTIQQCHKRGLSPITCTLSPL
ncbi:DNA polymerase nu [Liparis tanakae]|uniref:DNA polymerase nu n=1 Tax=Liparis tanakae TaxID=230148 RepID=A0A4Z2I452_9TELE|nr:DNA polymerase nu [Liparis tanakae]